MTLPLTAVNLLLTAAASSLHPSRLCPSPGQHLRLHIRQALLDIHATFPVATRTVPWVPDHCNICGNDQVDHLANSAVDTWAEDEKKTLDAEKARKKRGKKGRKAGYFQRSMLRERWDKSSDENSDGSEEEEYGGGAFLDTLGRAAIDARRPLCSTDAYTTSLSPSGLIPARQLTPQIHLRPTTKLPRLPLHRMETAMATPYLLRHLPPPRRPSPARGRLCLTLSQPSSAPSHSTHPTLYQLPRRRRSEVLAEEGG